MTMLAMIVFAERVMYWSDCIGDACKIEKAYLNGSGRSVLLNEMNHFYQSFSLSPDYLYFTDTKNA